MRIKYTIRKDKIWGNEFHDYSVVLTATDPRTMASGSIGPFQTEELAEIFIAECGGEVS